MAEELSTELVFVRRDIRKYLQRNLDADSGFMLPNSLHIQEEVKLIVTRHLMRVSVGAMRTKPGSMSLQVSLVASDGLHDLSAEANNEILEFVEQCYYKEFHAMVDQMHLYLRVPVRRAVETFRGLYEITEDDFAFRVSLRNYQRHRRRREGRSRIRGRHPLPLQLLKSPWKADPEMKRARPILGMVPPDPETA